ncbi:MAG: hypothetical protein ABH952_07505 [Candidatus Omnitrophota bacterium]
MRQIIAAVFVIAVFMFLCPTIPCQEALTTISGTIASLNLTSMTMQLEYTDEENIVQNTNLVLSEDIEVFDVGSLAELNVGDNVSVDCITDEAGLVAVYLYKFE